MGLEKGSQEVVSENIDTQLEASVIEKARSKLAGLVFWSLKDI